MEFYSERRVKLAAVIRSRLGIAIPTDVRSS
jgi:hypothetical protein